MKRFLLTIFALTAVFFTAVFVLWIQSLYTSQDFDRPVEASETGHSFERDAEPKKIVGLIVPHFEPVSFLTRDALKEVDMKPDIVILIGPNHFEEGSRPVIIGEYSSSKLRVRPKFALEEMKRFRSMGFASQEDFVISADHSIGTPLSILSEQFPDAKILPIVLKYRQNEDDMQKLILALQSISSKNILLVASVDFSHYLSSDIASSKDAETQKYIQNHDYKRIEALSSDYIDSPWTLITFLKYLEQNGLSEGRELSHTNTGKLAGQTIESSTSFFTYIFK
jgi:AmmeMemoRadiSam system protein B